MNFDLADLRAFVAVADLGSFSLAAKSLNLSQPALSRRIEKIETALRIQLFERTTRRVEMTTIGRSYVQSARHVLNELDNSLLGTRSLAEKLSGEVNIACVPSAVGYFLPSVIKTYHKRFPRIRIRVADETASAILLAVTRAQADFGLTYLGTQEPDIEFEPLFVEQFVAACPRNHPLARKSRVTWADLSNYEYLTVAQGSGNRTLIDLALAGVAQRPDWYCEVRHVPALVSLIEAGLGVGVVPRLAMPLEDHPTLVSIPIEEPSLNRTFGLIRRRGKLLSAAAQQFYDLLLESLRGNNAVLRVASPKGIVAKKTAAAGSTPRSARRTRVSRKVAAD
jgi:DNA-binding transcriptional LysR family regulator